MVTYEDIDKTLAGGLLPGGKPLTDKYAETKKSCKAAGGTWDSKNNT